MIRYFILFQIYAPGGSTKASMKVEAFFICVISYYIKEKSLTKFREAF